MKTVGSVCTETRVVVFGLASLAAAVAPSGAFLHSSVGHGAASAFAASYRDAMFVGAELALAGAIASLMRGEVNFE